MPTDTIAEEIWKDIQNHPGYQVSDYGRVRSFWKVSPQKGWYISPEPKRILTPRKQTRVPHYLHVALKSALGTKNKVVHLIVMGAFIGPVPEGMEGMHKDGNAWNNALSNLCWGTHSTNMRQCVLDGANKRQKLNPEKVRQIRALQGCGKSQREIAADFGVHQTRISFIWTNKHWQWVD